MAKILSRKECWTLFLMTTALMKMIVKTSLMVTLMIVKLKGLRDNECDYDDDMLEGENENVNECENYEDNVILLVTQNNSFTK